MAQWRAPAGHNTMTAVPRRGPEFPPPVCRLRRIAGAIRASRAPDHDDQAWLADALDRVLAGEPIASAFDMKPRPGQRTLATISALDRRNALLRDAAAQFFRDVPTAEQARRLSAALAHYHATAWQRERSLDACPLRHAGKIHELLWGALKANDRVLSARSIRLVLATS
jgi:hypothetical protein